MPLASSNNVNVAVVTSSDNSGINDTTKALGGLDQQAVKNSESMRNLTGAVAAGEAIYNALSAGLQKSAQFIQSSIESANKYQSAVSGLASMSRGLNIQVGDTTAAAQKLSSDGLMQVTQSATALKNLLSSGFSLPEAMQLLDSLRDKAAFNRQSFYSFGDAVVATTEGIKNGNSVMADAVGTTKNLSVMAKDAGVSVDEMGNIQQSASYRQAILNGFVGDAAVNYGDAARAAEMYGGKEAAAAAQTEKLKQSVGGVAQMISSGFLSAFTQFIAANQGMIVSLTFAVPAAVAFGLAMWGVIAAIKAFSIESLIAAATNPLLLTLTALSVIAGVVVFDAVGKLQDKLGDMNKSLTEGAQNTDGLAKSTGGLTKAQKDLAEKLADIDKQIAKNNRDFQESLAETIKQNQDKLTDLKKQEDQENKDFAKAQTKKLDDFKKTTGDMTDSHQKKVDKIQKQLNDEVALGKWANQAKIVDLEDQLSQENDDYNKQLSDKQANYDQDVADAKESHDQKTSDLQVQIDAENALLTKHAADVAAVRNVTMLDEIDKIKRSHDEQIQSYEDQKNKAIESSKESSAGVSSSYDDLMKNLQKKSGEMGKTGDDLGKTMGNAMKDAIKESLKDIGDGIVDFFSRTGTFMGANVGSKKPADMKSSGNSFIDSLMNSLKNFAHMADGGRVGAGEAVFVGDNPDGSLNSTSELFIPDRPGTIANASQTQQMLGGRGPVTMHNTFNIYRDMDLKGALVDLGWAVQNV